jgi:hypothetical protein
VHVVASPAVYIYSNSYALKPAFVSRIVATASVGESGGGGDMTVDVEAEQTKPVGDEMITHTSVLSSAILTYSSAPYRYSA